jgi:ABC-type lipoprotein release transport system permease subunit
VIFLLALRNIIRNKKNSAVVAALIAVIALLFFTGNSILARSGRGLRRSYIESLTGDLVIQKEGAVTMNLFGANAPIVDDYFTIPSLPAYALVRDLVNGMSEVEGTAGQVSTKARMEFEGARVGALVCGVDGGDYFPLFPGIQLEEGHFPQTGEAGVLLTREAVRELERKSGANITTGAPIMFTAAGSVGFRIREVPLAGIFSYTSPGGFMNSIAITDTQTARALASIQVATADVDVSEAAVTLLDLGEEDLFWTGDRGQRIGDRGQGIGDRGQGIGDSVRSRSQQSTNADNTVSTDIPDNNLPTTHYPLPTTHYPLPTTHYPLPTTTGDYNFLLVRLRAGVNSAVFMVKLNKALTEYGARAVGWRLAAGGSAILVLMISALYNGGIVLVSIAGLIAVVNILLIAVFRRTREIGTLRAIGAGDFYIRALVLIENALLGLAAGIASCVLGAALLAAVNGAGITIDNEILAAMLGGKLTIDFSPSVAALSLVLALVFSVLSSLYPVEQAVRIEPVVAVRQG